MYSLRALKSLLCRRVLALLALILTSAWISGLSDHLYEISFREFKWPPYEIDVLAETSRAMAGEPPRFLVLNNWNLFHSIREPECRMWNQTLQLLIIVKSASFNKKAREAIRQTWGMRESSGAVEIVFVVGKPEDADVANQKVVFDEIEEHDDLLYVDVIDTYRNNTLKFLHSIGYVYRSKNKCPSPKFVFLVDDDYMVNVISLLRLVSKKDPSKPLYEGWMFDTTPFRFRFHKHAVSLAMYPFDRYPPYITAGAVLLSHNSVAQFHHAIQLVKIYPYDDVYAGILAYLLRIPPTHNKAFVFWSRHVNKEDWIRGDVIAAHGYSPSQIN